MHSVAVRMRERLEGRLIFGRTTRIRALAPGPHAGAYRTQTHRIERPDRLVLLAEHDRAIPHAQSLQLGARLAKRPAIHVVAGTTHQSLPRSAGAQAAIARFLAAGPAA